VNSYFPGETHTYIGFLVKIVVLPLSDSQRHTLSSTTIVRGEYCSLLLEYGVALRFKNFKMLNVNARIEYNEVLTQHHFELYSHSSLELVPSPRGKNLFLKMYHHVFVPRASRKSLLNYFSADIYTST
jgi:hypothetical protein